jgi:putative phosphoribosyl transferase
MTSFTISYTEMDSVRQPSLPDAPSVEPRAFSLNKTRTPLRDRRHAGQVLAQALGHYRGTQDLLVLALPRGGVAVGYEVALALNAPLDVFIVRKLGYPGHEEYAMGAIASGGVRVLNPLPGSAVPAEAMEAVIAREQAELLRRERLYRGDQPAIEVTGHTVIVVDDGLATGSSMKAALRALRQRNPARLIAAVPVGAEDTVQQLGSEADEVVCPLMPRPFHAVGQWYADFPQSDDEEVHELLAASRREHGAATH